ncbi:MAG: hypothetical protein M1819_005596 [Sarea resinae]|nr:MAG: hypothetical protein M1819_005596 [Sarea resinae]
MPVNSPTRDGLAVDGFVRRSVRKSMTPSRPDGYVNTISNIPLHASPDDVISWKYTNHEMSKEGDKYVVWEDGDGDGAAGDEPKNWKLWGQDIGQLIKGTNEPPRWVKLDDKAAYDILNCPLYTPRERGVFWPDDFTPERGGVRASRPNRGRPALRPDGRKPEFAKLFNTGRLYEFLGDKTFSDVSDSDEERTIARQKENWGEQQGLGESSFGSAIHNRERPRKDLHKSNGKETNAERNKKDKTKDSTNQGNHRQPVAEPHRRTSKNGERSRIAPKKSKNNEADAMRSENRDPKKTTNQGDHRRSLQISDVPVPSTETSTTATRHSILDSTPPPDSPRQHFTNSSSLFLNDEEFYPRITTSEEPARTGPSLDEATRAKRNSSKANGDGESSSFQAPPPKRQRGLLGITRPDAQISDNPAETLQHKLLVTQLRETIRRLIKEKDVYKSMVDDLLAALPEEGAYAAEQDRNQVQLNRLETDVEELIKALKDKADAKYSVGNMRNKIKKVLGGNLQAMKDLGMEKEWTELLQAHNMDG